MHTRGFGTLWLVVVLVLACAPAVLADSTYSNGIYDIHVADSATGYTYGSWNAVTGSSHPTGSGNDLLYDDTFVDTNYSTLRLFTAAAGPVDYSFDGNGGGSNLDSFFTSDGSSPLGNGHRTNWYLPGPGLLVTQDVFVVGTTLGNSAIYHTVQISNGGNAPVTLGWRNLYDWAVNDPGFDDGPSNRIESVGSGVLVPTTTHEFDHTPTSDDYARVSVSPGTPTYEVLLGLGYDPGFLSSLPTTAPTRYAYTSWWGGYSSAFDYTVTPSSDVTGDSAGLSWFGHDLASAFTLPIDGTVRFTQTLYGVQPDAPPPGRNPVPEPGTLLLVGAGLAFGLYRRLRPDPS